MRALKYLFPHLKVLCRVDSSISANGGTVKKKTAWIIVSVILVANITVWALFFLPSSSNARTNYPYLSPRIFADNQNDILIRFLPLRKKLEAKFATLPTDTQYSFYFEYLPSGTSVKIGDDNQLVAASLIKLPLVMNLYRAAELNKINLDKEVTIQESELDGGYGSLYLKGAGTKYTLRQLAQHALEESDNTAAHAIYNHTMNLLSEEEQSLAQLDVDQDMKNGQAVINAKSYASVLKSLYFASFVNRHSSNEILGYLTNSTEHNRLTKELPSAVKVAHKNGVNDQSWAESDCGIVYAPKRPYTLCVMIGLPEDKANPFIADVSKMIYDYIVEQ